MFVFKNLILRKDPFAMTSLSVPEPVFLVADVDVWDFQAKSGHSIFVSLRRSLEIHLEVSDILLPDILLPTVADQHSDPLRR